ncbi:MAG: hypothetical protein H7A21_08235 [Spirochaetales bacterium]|nr:hypothetical protein [Leptospiraceae bacterium]MCP5481403.1 hypothetical protein [Spirochaetales bacterium]MCP5486053.1 hypothetical protein [Spirochaetales bacterium]
MSPGGSASLRTVTNRDPRLAIAAGQTGTYYLSNDGGVSWSGPCTIPGAGNSLSSVNNAGFPFQRN